MDLLCSNMAVQYGVGTIRVRTRHNRGGTKRAWIKVAEPNDWRLYACVVWEATNGAVPPGMLLHHKNGNALDDRVENLELLTRAQHFQHHRPEFEQKRIASSAKTRWARRWSTKSSTKRTGRPPSYTDESLQAAFSEVAKGMSCHSAGLKHGVPPATLYKKMAAKQCH